jgi:LuxR family maltose regulon positive regulatory protein
MALPKPGGEARSTGTTVSAHSSPSVLPDHGLSGMPERPSATTARGGSDEHRRPSFPIQRPKVQRPPLRDDTLHRGRLLDWLSVNIHHRLVLLVAEAGYGKTTLLADFARRTRLRTLWFRVDDEDRDWVSVLNYLVAAGREADQRFALATADRLAELGTTGGNREELVRTFLGELISLSDEPTVLVLDDYHVLDESPDARSIIGSVLARAPERFTLVLATRRRPNLAIARLRALGEVAELTTDDLRFTEHETEELFRDAYRQPLEPDVLVDLARRTEGWAASLQLVRAAVRERSTAQIRAFVRGLSGVDENLYDYLAEEVVGELEPAMQDFLMRTSILQVVDPVLAEVTTGVPQPDSRRLIEAAERLGLLARRGETARHTVRYHPLVRDFLEDRLRRDAGDETVRDLHRTVASHGESTDWRLAAYHYAAAAQGEDVRRVIRDSFEQLLGRSEAEGAHGYLTRFGSDHTDPVRLIVESRLDYASSRLPEAAAKAQLAYNRLLSMSGALRDVALMQLTTIESAIGPTESFLQHATSLADSAADPWLRSLGRGMHLLSEASESDLQQVIDHLEVLAAEHRRAELWHFVAVTLSNAAFAYRLMADPVRCRRRAEEALDVIATETETPIAATINATLAWAITVQGDLDRADEVLRVAYGVEHSLTRVETMLEGADIHIWYGSWKRADELLAAVGQSSDARYRRRMLLLSSAELAVRRGLLSKAAELLDEEREDRSEVETGHEARFLFVAALLSARRGDKSAAQQVNEAIAYCERRHVDLFRGPLTIVSAAIARDDAALSRAVIAVADRRAGGLSMGAEFLADRLDGLEEEARALVDADATCRPERWGEPLRLAVAARGPSSILAAELLDRIGSQDDVPLLRQFVKTSKRRGVDPGIGRGLARRLAARVFIEDLGRLQVIVGHTSIAGTEVRKKSLALLCFLLTRRDWSATREQVAEALWPDGNAETAYNSLNQTLYFLRRVFDSGYREDISAEYIHYEQEMLWLDPELVGSRSRIALEALQTAGDDQSQADLEHVVQSYPAPFALDFAYEDWATEFRDDLHVRFIELVERTLASDAASGQFDRAIWLARSALKVDPDADQLEALLVRLYRLSGSHAAAAEQYSHYARVLRSNLGVEPLALEEL